MAVLLPFLVGLMLFATDFARILYYTITIENCVHNCALFGSQVFDNQNQQWIAGGPQYWQGPGGQVVTQENAATDLDGTNLVQIPAAATSALRRALTRTATRLTLPPSPILLAPSCPTRAFPPP